VYSRLLGSEPQPSGSSLRLPTGVPE
jgi:hypothetical protein